MPLASLKHSLVVIGVRTWIRYAPTNLFKESLWRFAHWRDHHYVAPTKMGFRMKGRSVDLVQGYIYYFGIWEPNLTAWLSKRFCEMSDGVFLDVGANVGYYSLLAHRLMTKTNAVVSVEASPMIHRMLTENIRLNRFDRIRTINCAAAAEHGTLTLYQAIDNNLGASTTKAGVWEGDGVSVDAKPLSSLLTDEEVRDLRLVKIDVEGAEQGVIEGLQPILHRLRNDVEFVVEISAGNAAPIFDIMRKAGFNAYSLPNVYSYKSYLTPPPIVEPQRLADIPQEHGDVIFSRRDQPSL